VFDGRTLRSIHVAGLGISKEDFLAQSRLPVHEGDTVTRKSMEDTVAAVKTFDEHLTTYWTAPADEPDGGVDLTIAAPGPGNRSKFEELEKKVNGMRLPSSPEGSSAAPQAGQNVAPAGSGGVGKGKGIGVGPGNGAEFGPGSGGGFGGGAYRIGGGVSAPVPIHQPEAEYSEEARKAKWQGAVLLSLVVDESGKAVGVKVTKSLGLGLDQKAIEAVEKWRFKPGMLNGQPVPVQANIEVNFRSLQ